MKRSTTARGYGAAHRKERARWAAIVERGEASCARCRRPITPGTAWDLDHATDRVSYLGPSHSVCNRKAGGKISAQKRRRTALTW